MKQLKIHSRPFIHNSNWSHMTENFYITDSEGRRWHVSETEGGLQIEPMKGEMISLEGIPHDLRTTSGVSGLRLKIEGSSS